MIQDFKFAVRQLFKAPGFTAVAVLTLALAIGINSAIFALINGVVLHPVVPLRPSEVVNVFTARQNASHDYRQFSYNEFRELREDGGEVFANVAALEFAVAGIGRDHEMRRSFAFLTSENYFSMMGVQPYRGRFYETTSRRAGADWTLQPLLRAASHLGHGADSALAHVALRRRTIFSRSTEGCRTGSRLQGCGRFDQRIRLYPGQERASGFATIDVKDGRPRARIARRSGRRRRHDVALFRFYQLTPDSFRQR